MDEYAIYNQLIELGVPFNNDNKNSIVIKISEKLAGDYFCEMC